MPRRRTALWVGCVLVLAGLDAGVAAERGTQVSYRAADQEAAALIAALGTLSGETFQPDVDLLVSGINSTRASLCLVDASPASARQALAFALDCWWADDPAGTAVVLSTGERLPRGRLEVRTLTSTLRRQVHLHQVAERLLAPWLGGQAGISYLPTDGQWSATLDSEGHRRLVEFLSLCERPNAQASSRITDPAAPDPRRTTTRGVSATTWPTLVEGMAEALAAPVSLSPRLRLRAFPEGLRLPQQSIAQVVANLRAHGVTAHWSQGVLCLAEGATAAVLIDRQHPAQRRRLALIPIGHLLKTVVDGELVVTALRRHVAVGWWNLPGAGIEFLPDSGALLVAADVDAQQAVLGALSAIDTLGLDLGLQTITAGAR